MAIDPYSSCPCGSGKKIKFCCRDLAPEIEKIERMIEADQRHACLDHIDQLEKKFPDRPYLQLRKASLMRQLDRADEADALLKELIHREPTNPIIWAEAVFLVLDREDQEFRVAIELLQRAIDASGEALPLQVSEALALVAQYAFSVGLPLVCLKHMHLYLERGAESNNALYALVRFRQSRTISPLTKNANAFPEPDEGELPAEAIDSFAKIKQAADIGLIRGAERQLSELCEQYPKSKTLWQSLALARAWLGDNLSAVEALRALASLEIEFDDAVEHEALAQLLDEDEAEMIDVVELELTTEDLEATRQALKASGRIDEYDGPLESDDGTPPPRAIAQLLDKPMPENPAIAEFDDYPAIIGRLGFFGQETDRAARVSLIAQEDSLDDARKELLAICGDQLTQIASDRDDNAECETPGRKVVDQVSRYAAPYTHRKFIPSDTGFERRYEIIQETRRRMLLDVWPKEAVPTLDGLTPEAAAAGSNMLRIRVAAMILNMELASQRETVSANAFDELRGKLNLPIPAAPIPAVAEDADDATAEQIPLVRLARVEPEKLSDQGLLELFYTASEYRFPPAIVKLGQEIMSRDHLLTEDAEDSAAQVCGAIADMFEDSRVGLEWNDRAREYQIAKGESCAEYDLFELYIRINRGEGDETSRLLTHLMENHGSEPGVRQAVTRVLYEVGLVNAEGELVNRDEPAIVTADGDAGTTGKIWTPDGAAAAATGEQSKIWTPE